jgi:hypothetical protein
VDAGNDPPVPVIDTPGDSLTWAVGDTIDFSGHATDAQDGPLAASSLSWDVVMVHCPADCHLHFVQTIAGVASGSFTAPDHEYPSHLELRLTATDSHGTRATTSVELQPKTATIDVTSSPAGVPLTVAGVTRAGPIAATVILGGTTTVSAPTSATVGGKPYRFSAWSDGGARVHDVTASGPVNLTATYLQDAPGSCGSATSVSPSGAWISERTDGSSDVDWFRFRLSSKHRVVVTLGDLPADLRLDLYKSCSKLVASSSHGGTRFEELTKLLAAGTYRVRVTNTGGAASASPYVLRFKPMKSGLPIKSTHTTIAGGRIRIAGEVMNNTGSIRGRITVTARFRNAAGHVVATLSTKTFARRLGIGKVSSFVLSGAVPAYARVTLSTTSGAPGPRRTLSLRALTVTANPDGTATESGIVRNIGTTTARSVAVSRTWYGPRGQVLDRRTVAVSPSTLKRGTIGRFSITRPALAGIQAVRTELRAR